jgi:TPR repeat protein
MNFYEWMPLAKEGVAKAQYNLGLIYNRGKEVLKDDKEAVRWYRLAAEQGFPEAQTNLGLMYESGQGVEQDYVKAQKWFNIAGVNGNETGRKNADILEKKCNLVRSLLL